ncbi:hypothetical protein SAMN05216332_11070 [Nitrosospira briensis]|nr:hypothetical protein SAMN05216332_11070 [Nitrosospira briensis]
MVDCPRFSASHGVPPRQITNPLFKPKNHLKSGNFRALSVLELRVLRVPDYQVPYSFIQLQNVKKVSVACRKLSEGQGCDNLLNHTDC